MSAKDHNIHMVEIVASGLKNLLPEIVFVGGATTALYLSEDSTKDPSGIRPTDDVDCVIEVTSRTEYTKLEEKIRALGFRHSVEQGAPLCRWIYSGVTVDIMPTDSKIIGFYNKWYKDGMKSAVDYELPSGLKIRIFTIPYFLASKIEAFKGRGKNDYLGSQDFEDIITVLAGRKDIRQNLAGSPAAVKAYLREQFKAWESSLEFQEGLTAHLPTGSRDAEGARRVLDIIKNA
jgi:predicted nucleotidyltransferase